jgi:phosphoribosylformimino-5-aminoimidazole carboxamide ribotide isomerase
MLLIIPAIEIKDGKCAKLVQGSAGTDYTDDPVEMARLWRKENAKSLHVTDLDGAAQGRPVNFDVIRRMIKAVDIPIELGGGLRTFQDVKSVIEGGAFRAVIGTLFTEYPEEAARLIDVYGASRVVLGIQRRNPAATAKGDSLGSGPAEASMALNAKQIGFKRLIYKDLAESGQNYRPNFQGIRMIAEMTQMRITVSGGVSGLDDLFQLQELEPLGVDSVIIGSALYENKFSCQGLWRLCEAGNFPYTAKV